MEHKNEVRYQMIETTSYVEDSGLVTTYGIRYREDEKSRKRKRAEYGVVPDISTESGFVGLLVDKLLAHDVDPVHLKDLIDDHLP